MLTGKTILSHSAGTVARLTLIASSSPSPSPVRLSPVCSTEPSGLVRLLKKTKWASERILPFAPSISADASRSKSAPVVDRASHPRPTRTAVRPGACLLSETLPPLLRLTLTAVFLLARVPGGSTPSPPVRPSGQSESHSNAPHRTCLASPATRHARHHVPSCCGCATAGGRRVGRPATEPAELPSVPTACGRATCQPLTLLGHGHGFVQGTAVPGEAQNGGDRQRADDDDERQPGRDLGHERHLVTAVEERQLVGVQRVYQQFHADEAED